jgi:hypothetical protein
MKELEQKADELVSKHLPFAKTWDCYWDKPSEEKNHIKAAIQSVNYTIDILEKLQKVFKRGYLCVNELLDEQIELKKILESRL